MLFFFNVNSIWGFVFTIPFTFIIMQRKALNPLLAPLWHLSIPEVRVWYWQVFLDEKSSKRVCSKSEIQSPCFSVEEWQELVQCGLLYFSFISSITIYPSCVLFHFHLHGFLFVLTYTRCPQTAAQVWRTTYLFTAHKRGCFLLL